MVQGMADLRTNFEVSQKQTEVDLLSQKRKNQRIINIATSISTVLIFILAISLFKRYQYIKETNRIIGDERERSEKLLLNILPEETSLELKKYGQVKAKKFESVTVLFADFKEFTKIAETVDPEVLVKSIDFYFKEFDRITTQFGLEKIKTIGDEYMCAGGIPVENKTHALSAILAAKKMNKLIEDQLHSDIELIQFELRIGIHTGPVVAGIVGLKKWQYDIWGDTVNIASRMQSMSEPGRINLSESTYNEIKDEFPCEYRGEMEVKHRGSLKMYFLSNGQ
jgi:class 3 adenylate cyclase